jgi:hypothetical protein
MKDKLLLAVVFAFSVPAYGQDPTVSQTSTPVAESPQAARIAAPVTFHSDLLGLSFTYPGSLVAEKMPSLDEQHAALARRYGPDEKPEDRKTDQCSDRALVARRKDEPATPGGAVTVTGTFYADKRGLTLESNHAVTAKILISRIGIECMPTEEQNQIEDVAGAMSVALTKDEDLLPIDQPMWYGVGKTHIHFAAARSTPEMRQAGTGGNGQKERRWVASIAFVSNGNLVSILIESNDLPFLNEMLHGEIALGRETAAPLFPAEIGNGAPLQPKP